MADAIADTPASDIPASVASASSSDDVSSPGGGGGLAIIHLTQYSWNVFRYIGDYMHLFGVFMLLGTLAKNKSCQGISRSTQILYFTIFITRYLDIMSPSQNAYLIFFKLTYIITSAVVLCVFYKLDKTYERQKDTCSLTFIFVPVLTATVLLANEYSIIEMLWSFSQFLEAFAMVPQYIFCYRDRGSTDVGVTLYMMSMGGYRVFYAANWIYKKIQMPQYLDIQSWLSGIVEILFFNDYLLSRFTGCSLLRAVVLMMDEKINEVKDRVSNKVLGRESVSVVDNAGAGGECEMRQRRGGAASSPADV